MNPNGKSLLKEFKCPKALHEMKSWAQSHSAFFEGYHGLGEPHGYYQPAIVNS